MSDNPTQEEVLASIVPDSTQINAEDLVSGPKTYTIEKVSRGTREQPINIHLVGCDRMYRPCKTMRRVLIAVFSDDPAKWIGHQMTLYCDPGVIYAGVKVGGVRISHLSGLENPRTFMLAQSRGKRTEVTIRPIKTKPAEKPVEKPPEPTVEEQAFIETAKAEIGSVSTLPKLRDLGLMLKEQSKVIQDAVRPVYVAKKAELDKFAAKVNGTENDETP